MSGEAEIELEVDANVEIEIDVQPEVELEVVVDLEAPKVEIELEIEAPQVEIEINCPDLNVESNLEGKLNAEVEVGGSTQIVYQGGNSNHMPYLVCRWMFCSKPFLNALLISTSDHFRYNGCGRIRLLWL